MAECRLCGRDVWFFKLSALGLCETCEFQRRVEVPRTIQIIEQSRDLVASSTKLDTRVTRCNLVIDKAAELSKYEQRNIGTTSPPPSVLIAQYQSWRDDIIRDQFKVEIQASLKKTGHASVKARVGQLSKLLVKSEDYRHITGRPSDIDEIASEIKAHMHGIQLHGFLDDAEKAEFKGQQKKALDRYYEALYFLRRDDVDDRLQHEHIKVIEEKIRRLGGKLGRE